MVEWEIDRGRLGYRAVAPEVTTTRARFVAIRIGGSLCGCCSSCSFLPGARKHVHDVVGRWWQKCASLRIGGRWEEVLGVFVVVRDGFHDDHGIVVAGDGTIRHLSWWMGLLL